MAAPQPFTSGLDRLVEDTMGEWKVPGLAMAIVNGDEITARGYGVASMSGDKVTPSTLFDCASMSKSFTAAALSTLVDDPTRPEVRWTTPVSKLMKDDFVLPDRYATENVTIEDILCHRSGMPRHDESYMGINAQTPDTPLSVTRNLRNLPLSRPLRTEYQYCNMMYVAASHLVEVLSGSSFRDFLSRKIWAPLGMGNTYLGIEGVEANRPDDPDTGRLAAGYRWDEDDGAYVELPWLREPEGHGAGSIVSSVLDYAKWIRAMIRRPVDGPLSRAGHDELVRPRILEGGERIRHHSDACYALGWVVEHYRGEPVILHGGCVRGFGGLMLFLPERGWGCVILGNSEPAADAATKMGWHLVDDLLGVPAVDRFDWDAHLRKETEEALRIRSREELYPDLPDPPTPMAAPMDAYAGSYTNPGYHTLAVEVADGRLQADASDRSFGFTLFLEHVSGEYFIAEIVDTYTLDRTTMKAEFQLDKGGKVQRLGVAFAEEMESLIWFERDG